MPQARLEYALGAPRAGISCSGSSGQRRWHDMRPSKSGTLVFASTANGFAQSVCRGPHTPFASQVAIKALCLESETLLSRCCFFLALRKRFRKAIRLGEVLGSCCIPDTLSLSTSGPASITRGLGCTSYNTAHRLRFCATAYLVLLRNILRRGARGCGTTSHHIATVRSAEGILAPHSCALEVLPVSRTYMHSIT